MQSTTAVARESCVMCGAVERRGEIPHEPWCPHFLRPSAAAAGQLSIEDVLGEAESDGR